MKTIAIAALACASFLEANDAAARLLDAKANVSQRADACYELRGNRSRETLAAMRRVLEVDSLRACAGRNLREAGALAELKDALGDENPDVRALAARELGAFGRPDLLDPLAKAARDPNVMVASSAMQGPAEYQIPAVVPYLVDLAKSGGMVGAMALRRAAQLKDPAILPVARELLGSGEAVGRLDAIRVLADLGDASDIAALGKIAGNQEQLSAAGRGFGLMPGVDLSKAAAGAIESIRRRSR
jgi:HEAT repeat protein